MKPAPGTRVLILDADMVPALTVARSLARRQCHVSVASHTPRAIAARSRVVSVHHVYPDPLSQAAEFVSWLRAHTQEHSYALVIPVTERTLVLLSRHRQEFSGVNIAMPAEHSLDTVLDKSKTLALAASLDVPIPKGIPVDSLEQLSALRASLNYPVVIKPTRSIGSNDAGSSQLQVSYAFDPIGLESGCVHALRFGSVVLQEYFKGVGVGIELIADDGEILYAFQHRRLHEVPLTGGGSSLRKSEPVHPQLLEASRKLVAALRWRGVAMVEFKLDPDTGAFCLMEINGRFWGSLPLAESAGADFPAMLFDLETGIEFTPCPAYKNDVSCRLLSRDLLWYESVLRGDGDQRIVDLPDKREILRSLGLMLSPRHRFDVQSLFDPWPGIFDIGNIFESYGKRISTLMAERRFLRSQQRAWRRGEVAKAIAAADSILFMCYGNINRSALADVMVRAYAEDTGVKVQSAGFHSEEGRSADPVMIDIAADNGENLRELRSSLVTEQQLQDFNVIFVMEKQHYDRLLSMTPEVAGKTYLLGAHPGGPMGLPEIEDPYGRSREAYQRCFDRVAEAIDHVKSLLAVRTMD